MQFDLQDFLIDRAINEMTKAHRSDKDYQISQERYAQYMNQIQLLLPKKGQELLMRFEESENDMRIKELEWIYFQGLRDGIDLLRMVGLL